MPDRYIVLAVTYRLRGRAADASLRGRRQAWTGKAFAPTLADVRASVLNPPVEVDGAGRG
jgi:hypothetical protein